METYDSCTNGNRHNRRRLRIESNGTIAVPAITASSNIELARGRKIRFGVTRDEGEAPYYGPLAKEFRCSLEFFLTRGEIASEARCRFEVAQGSPLRPRRRVIAKPFVRERERKRIVSSGKLARRILNRWTTAGG